MTVESEVSDLKTQVTALVDAVTPRIQLINGAATTVSGLVDQATAAKTAAEAARDAAATNATNATNAALAPALTNISTIAASASASAATASQKAAAAATSESNSAASAASASASAAAWATTSKNYWVTRGAGSVKKSTTGTYTPGSVTFKATTAVGNEAPTAYAGRFVIATSIDGVNFTDSYTSVTDESTKTYTIPANTVALRMRFYLAGGVTTLLNEEVIPVVFDGDSGVTSILSDLTLTIDPTQSELAGVRYQNPINAFGWLASRRIAANATVTLQCSVGVHTFSGEWVSFDHPDSSRIELVGAAPDYKSVVAQSLITGVNITGSAGDYRVTVALDNVTGIAVGDVVALHRFTATSEFCGVAMGAWQVHGVDTANNKITVRNTARRSTFLPSGFQIDITSGRCTVFKTVIRPTTTTHSAALNLARESYIRDLAFLGRVAGVNTDDTVGLTTSGQGIYASTYGGEARYSNGRVLLENVVLVYAPAHGLEVSRGRIVELCGNNDSVFMACGSVGRGVTVGVGSRLGWNEKGRRGYGGPHIVCNGNAQQGLLAEENSAVVIYGNAFAPNRLHAMCGNLSGCASGTVGYINLGAARVECNSGYGLQIGSRGSAIANDSSILWSGVGGCNVELNGYLQMTGNDLARIKYSSGMGIYAGNASLVHANCLIAGGSGAPYYSERGAVIRGRVIVPKYAGCVVTAACPANAGTGVPGLAVCDYSFEFYDYWYAATSVSASISAVSNTRYFVTSDGVTITLPPSPVNGEQVFVFSPSAITTIARNGRNIGGSALDYVMQKAFTSQQIPAIPDPRVLRFTYVSASDNWQIDMFDYGTWAAGDTLIISAYYEISGGTKCVWPSYRYAIVGGPVTCKLPENPTSGDVVQIATGGITTGVIDRNGKTINGAAANYSLSTQYKTYTARYSSNFGWTIN